MKTNIKHHTATIATILVIIVFQLSCDKKVGNKDLNFNDQILPIFISNCAGSGCHNSKDMAAKYDFTNYEGIMKGVVPKKPLRSEVYTNIKGANPSMPIAPYNKLKQAEVELIKLWINMGAPNSISKSDCDSIYVTFSKSVQPILESWCVGCHNTSNKSADIDLSNYDGVKFSNLNNRLLGSIKYLDGFSKMPKNSIQLSDCDIAKIEKWIKTGAINN
jgi:cytochrome c553